MRIAFHKHNLELMVATWLFPSDWDDLENFSLVDLERGSLGTVEPIPQPF